MCPASPVGDDINMIDPISYVSYSAMYSWSHDVYE